MKHSILVLFGCLFSLNVAMAAPPHHPPPPSHPPVRPPVVVRPPTLPNQVILEQRRARDMAERRREEEISITPREADTIDDNKIWDDVANMSGAELFALLDPQEFQIEGLDRESLDAAKALVIADLKAEGRSTGQMQDMTRMVDGTFRGIEHKAWEKGNDFTFEVAKEFKRIYAANCCGEAEFSRALGEAKSIVSNQFVDDMTASLDHQSRATGMSFNAHVNLSYDENTGQDGNNQAVQAVRALGQERGAETQVANVTPTGATPAPAPETPAVEAPAPPAQPDNTTPAATSTPTLRETVAPSPQVDRDSTTTVATRTPTVRETVVLTPPETPSHNLLTPVPAYTPADNHSMPTTTAPIRTTSVPSLRERPSVPPTRSRPTSSGPSFVGSIAAIVGPAIRSGFVSVANWMDDHELLGRDYGDRPDRTNFHGIGSGAFEGRLGYSMKPTKVIKGGIAGGSNLGGGLVLCLSLYPSAS